MKTLNRLLAWLGYVPASDYADCEARLSDALKRLSAVQSDLGEQNRYHEILKHELSVMRALTATRNQLDLSKSVSRLDEICDELQSMLPARYLDRQHEPKGVGPEAPVGV